MYLVPFHPSEYSPTCIENYGNIENIQSIILFPPIESTAAKLNIILAKNYIKNVTSRASFALEKRVEKKKV